MKRISFIFTVLMLFSVASAFAVVDLEIAQSSLSLTGEPGQTVSGSFTLENTGNESITVSFTENQLEKGSEDINFEDISDVSLGIGSTQSISFQIDIPNGQELGTYTGSIEAESGSASDTVSISLLVNSSGGLNIDDLDVFVTTLPRHNRDSERDSIQNVADGDTLTFDEEEVGPGAELRLTFDIENLFDEDTEIDIEGVTVLATLVEIDDGDDLEEESEEQDINAGKTTDFELIFEIPIAIEQDTYDMIIEVEGDGDDGNTYKEEMAIKVKVDKESRDLLLRDVELFPTSLSCSGSSRLSFDLYNIGSRVEERARFTVTNAELGLNYEENNINLDDDPFDADSVRSKNIPITVSETTRTKSYPIRINAYLQDDIIWDSKTVNLQVSACDTPPEPEEEPEEEPEQEEETEEPEETGEESEAVDTEQQGSEETEGETTTTTVPVLKPSSSTEPTLTEKPSFWIVFILVNLAIVAAIIVIVPKLLRK